MDELRKLAEFLCIQVNEDLLRAVVDKCHLERMRKDKLPYEWLIDGKNSHYHKGRCVGKVHQGLRGRRGVGERLCLNGGICFLYSGRFLITASVNATCTINL